MKQKRTLNYFTSIFLIGIIIDLVLIAPGYYSARLWVNQVNIGDFGEFSWLGGIIIPMFYLYSILAAILLFVMPIIISCFTLLVLGSARLLQLGEEKKWKKKLSVFLIHLEVVVKVLFLVGLLLMCLIPIYLGYVMLSLLLIIQFAVCVLQTVAIVKFLKKIKEIPAYKEFF